MLDLDRFKSVNDTYGHLVGDELLRQAADRLAKLVGKDDLVARLGGDEFAILQRVSSFETEAPALARKVNRAMAQPFPTSRMTVSIGATVGVARGRVDGASAVELMQAADLALYAAKGDGRGCARVFRRELTEAARGARQARGGLATRAGGARIPSRLSTDLFAASATRSSATKRCCAGAPTAATWSPRPSSFPSPRTSASSSTSAHGRCVAPAPTSPRCPATSRFQSTSPRCSSTPAPSRATSARRCARAVLRPRRLRIEITESTLLQDKPVVADQIRALRDLGVGVSLDDFGTGYSCLSYLEMYPIDTLKIDRLFVAKLGAQAGGGRYAARHRRSRPKLWDEDGRGGRRDASAVGGLEGARLRTGARLSVGPSRAFARPFERARGLTIGPSLGDLDACSQKRSTS